MHRTRIKICGFTREADVIAALQAGVDAMGLVLYAQSPRAVTPARAAALAREIGPFCTPVLLFVNASADEVQRGLDAVPNALLQFHGDETAAQCQALAASRPYIRAARMQPGFDLLQFSSEYASAAALLLDTHSAAYGGTGKVFDWSLVPPNVGSRLVLSGGLTPANVTDGVLALKPYAVDVSSGVELSKGIKSAELIRNFVECVRRADAKLSQDHEHNPIQPTG
jgi:phosphoribosylanthranilate isomerase